MPAWRGSRSGSTVRRLVCSGRTQKKGSVRVGRPVCERWAEHTPSHRPASRGVRASRRATNHPGLEYGRSGALAAPSAERALRHAPDPPPFTLTLVVVAGLLPRARADPLRTRDASPGGGRGRARSRAVARSDLLIGRSRRARASVTRPSTRSTRRRARRSVAPRALAVVWHAVRPVDGARNDRRVTVITVM